MSDHEPVRVRDKPPPGWLLSVLNPSMRRLLPTPVGRWIPGFALLRFRGRRTGRPYTVPVGMFRDHRGARVVFSDGRWTLNLAGGARIDVVHRGRTEAARAELVTDPAYIGPAIRTALDAGSSQLMLGLSIEPGHRPSDAELAAVRHAVAISLPEHAGPA